MSEPLNHYVRPVKQIFFIALLLILFPALVLSQPAVEDVVYLKDGGVLRGEIIEYLGEESLRLKTAGRNVFVIRLDDIREIKKEEVPGARYYKTSGYMNQTGMSFLPGPNDTPVRFQMVNGYRFTPQLVVGLGVGFTLYDDPLNLIPLFADLRYRLFKANTTPIVFARSGYSISILPENRTAEGHRGGFMMNVGMGIQFDTRGGFGWSLTAGYNMANSHFREDGWGGRTVNHHISHRRLQLGLGLTF